MMTPAELRCAREFLGVDIQWLADYLGVDRKTLWRWESGITAIPLPQSNRVYDLQEMTGRAVSNLATKGANGTIITFTTEPEGWGMPASWHRMVCARAAERCGARIDYKLADAHGDPKDSAQEHSTETA